MSWFKREENNIGGGGEKNVRTEGLWIKCEGCGQVIGLQPHDLDAIRDEIHNRFGLTARFAHFPIVGLCAGCAATGAAHQHHH